MERYLRKYPDLLDGSPVIASKVAAPTHPDWYHNLVAHAEATIELGAERFPVRARVAEGKSVSACSTRWLRKCRILLSINAILAANSQLLF